MQSVRLDEDINSRKKVQRPCQKQGLVDVKRFPSKLAGQEVKDPVVIENLVCGSDDLFLTIDRNFVVSHLQFFTTTHGGVLIVRQADRDIKTMTTDIAMGIIDNLKVAITDWHSLEWRNSIVNVSPDEISVYHIKEHELHKDMWQLRSSDWVDEFKRALRRNAMLA